MGILKQAEEVAQHHKDSQWMVETGAQGLAMIAMYHALGGLSEDADKKFSAIIQTLVVWVANGYAAQGVEPTEVQMLHTLQAIYPIFMAGICAGAEIGKIGIPVEWSNMGGELWDKCMGKLRGDDENES